MNEADVTRHGSYWLVGCSTKLNDHQADLLAEIAETGSVAVRQRGTLAILLRQGLVIQKPMAVELTDKGRIVNSYLGEAR